GTDGLFVFALIHELLKAGRVDLDYLLRYTNAHVLVIQEPGAVDDGLFLRDSDGTLVAWDRVAKTSVNATEPDAKPALTGSFTVDGRRCVPVFQLIADRYLD
ncbi:formate dehydrogenase, partial [Mesorhizobium sp. M00.F.Ca.ET.158.01.1.1]